MILGKIKLLRPVAIGGVWSVDEYNHRRTEYEKVVVAVVDAPWLPGGSAVSFAYRHDTRNAVLTPWTNVFEFAPLVDEAPAGPPPPAEPTSETPVTTPSPKKGKRHG